MRIEIGIIGGSGLTEFMTENEHVTVYTPYGKASDDVEISKFCNKTIAFIPRHGRNHNIPPHRINYKANIYALKKLGVNKIISITSVGSLKKEIKPSSIFITSDYINFSRILTYYNTRIVHVTPEIDNRMMNIVYTTGLRMNMDIHRGIYIQTHGPRLETKAEISMLKHYGDVVGMNAGTECTLANELNVRFVNICTVDNYAHGITTKKLKFEDILKNAKNNRKLIMSLLEKCIEEISMA